MAHHHSVGLSRGGDSIDKDSRIQAIHSSPDNAFCTPIIELHQSFHVKVELDEVSVQASCSSAQLKAYFRICQPIWGGRSSANKYWHSRHHCLRMFNPQSSIRNPFPIFWDVVLYICAIVSHLLIAGFSAEHFVKCIFMFGISTQADSNSLLIKCPPHLLIPSLLLSLAAWYSTLNDLSIKAIIKFSCHLIPMQQSSQVLNLHYCNGSSCTIVGMQYNLWQPPQCMTRVCVMKSWCGAAIPTSCQTSSSSDVQIRLWHSVLWSSQRSNAYIQRYREDHEEWPSIFRSNLDADEFVLYITTAIIASIQHTVASNDCWVCWATCSNQLHCGRGYKDKEHLSCQSKPYLSAEDLVLECIIAIIWKNVNTHLWPDTLNFESIIMQIMKTTHKHNF